LNYYYLQRKKLNRYDIEINFR